MSISKESREFVELFEALDDRTRAAFIDYISVCAYATIANRLEEVDQIIAEVDSIIAENYSVDRIIDCTDRMFNALGLDPGTLPVDSLRKATVLTYSTDASSELSTASAQHDTCGGAAHPCDPGNTGTTSASNAE